MATSAEELTDCVICTKVFTDPQVLPCNHVFCKSCVNRIKDAGTIKCPYCRRVCDIDAVKVKSVSISRLQLNALHSYTRDAAGRDA